MYFLKFINFTQSLTTYGSWKIILKEGKILCKNPSIQNVINKAILQAQVCAIFSHKAQNQDEEFVVEFISNWFNTEVILEK